MFSEASSPSSTAQNSPQMDIPSLISTFSNDTEESSLSSGIATPFDEFPVKSIEYVLDEHNTPKPNRYSVSMREGLQYYKPVEIEFPVCHPGISEASDVISLAPLVQKAIKGSEVDQDMTPNKLFKRRPVIKRSGPDSDISSGSGLEDIFVSKEISTPVEPMPSSTSIFSPAEEADLSLEIDLPRMGCDSSILISPNRFLKTRPVLNRSGSEADVSSESCAEDTFVCDRVEATTTMAETAQCSSPNLSLAEEAVCSLEIDFALMSCDSSILNIADALWRSGAPPLMDHPSQIALLAVLLPVYSAAVGACILLAPSYISNVAFSHGLYFTTPPQGIQRLSHWSYCAWPHVATFLSCIFVLCRYAPYLGVSIAVMVLTGAYAMWSDFKLDEKKPLGTDDRQSVFLALNMQRKQHTLDGHCVEVRGKIHVIPVGSGLTSDAFC